MLKMMETRPCQTFTLMVLWIDKMYVMNSEISPEISPVILVEIEVHSLAFLLAPCNNHIFLAERNRAYSSYLHTFLRQPIWTIFLCLLQREDLWFLTREAIAHIVHINISAFTNSLRHCMLLTNGRRILSILFAWPFPTRFLWKTNPYKNWKHIREDISMG
jgi:hypothetical protein